VSDVYNNVELPNPDAKVAAILCGGGPCIYVTNPAVDAAMMNSFILSHVVPNVKERLPESACLVLGQALMWLITSSIADVYVPAVEVKDQVLSDWAHVCGGDMDVDGTDLHKNPIQKLAVVVSGDHGAVFIDTVGEMEGEGGCGKGDSRVGMQGSHANFRNQITGRNAVMSIGIETGEHGVEECNQWIKDEHGSQFWGLKWKCSTSRDATDNEFGSAGGGGCDELRGSGTSAAAACCCWGQRCYDACDPHAYPPGVFMTSGRSMSMVSVGEWPQGFFPF
jgi:hypothetical protein